MIYGVPLVAETSLSGLTFVVWRCVRRISMLFVMLIRTLMFCTTSLPTLMDVCGKSTTHVRISTLCGELQTSFGIARAFFFKTVYISQGPPRPTTATNRLIITLMTRVKHRFLLAGLCRRRIRNDLPISIVLTTTSLLPGW